MSKKQKTDIKNRVLVVPKANRWSWPNYNNTFYAELNETPRAGEIFTYQRPDGYWPSSYKVRQVHYDVKGDIILFVRNYP